MGNTQFFEEKLCSFTAARGDDFELKTGLLNESDGENYDADYKHTAHAGLLTVADNKENPSTTRGTQYRTCTEAAGHSTDSIKNMRFIVVGSDNNLMNNVPEFILGESQTVHLQNELKTEYEKKESELLRKLREMNETEENQQKKIRDLKTEVRLKDAMLQEEIHKRKALEQKLTEAGAEQALLTRGQPGTAQRMEAHKDESEEEIEAREEDLQASGLQKSEGLKTVRRGSKEIDPPNMSEHKDERGEIDTREEDSQPSAKSGDGPQFVL